MKYVRIAILLITTVYLWGCQDSLTSYPQPQTSMDLNGSHRMAEYIRNEPAVKSVKPWEESYHDGLIIQTEHYTLYTTLLEPLMLRQTPAFLEAAYKAYQSQLPQPISSGRPLEVYLFDTRSQWETFTRSIAGEDARVYLQIQRGAYTVNGIVVAYNIGRKQTFSVIGHEGWHQFNQRLFTYRLPSWLDEGIATLFETCSYTQGRFVFEPSRNLMRLGSLKETLLSKQMIPLAQLITLNPGQFIDGHSDNEAVIGFYAQNYALVRFLREYKYGLRLRQYHAMLLDGANGRWPLQSDLAAFAADRTRRLTVGWNMQVSPILFTHYIDSDFDSLQAQYLEFCKKIVYHVQIK